MKRTVLVLLALAAAMLGLGCGGVQIPPCILDGTCLPTPPPPTTCPDGLPPGPQGCTTACPPGQVSVPDGFGGGTHCEPPHSPVCGEGNVSECWHHPPEGWRWNCKGGTPTVSDPKECPAPIPVPAGCAPLQGPATCTERKDMAADAKPEHGAAVDRAIDAACAAEGVACGPDGPARPGTWDAFVARVGGALEADGLCPTYDYLHGEEGGRASELSVRAKGSAHVESYQVESSEGRVRRPPGAWRSSCEGGGEGQPIRPPAATQPPPSAPCPVVERFDVVLHNPAAKVYNATPKAGDRARCISIGKQQDKCPLGPEGSAEQHACEAARVGEHGPTWEAVGGTLEIIPQGDPSYLAKVKGSGTLRVCTQAQQPQVCGQAVIP